MNEEKTELPLPAEIGIMVAIGVGICFWKGKEDALVWIGFLIPIVILAVPIERILKNRWPDWAEFWYLKSLDKFRFMIASGISALIVLPSYFYIIEPLTN
jgi:hypothetical protein